MGVPLFKKKTDNSLERINPETLTDAVYNEDSLQTLASLLPQMGQFMGVYTPYDGNIVSVFRGKRFAIAAMEGTYPQCSNLTVKRGEIVVFSSQANSSVWTKSTLIESLISSRDYILGYIPAHYKSYLYSLLGTAILFDNSNVYVCTVQGGLLDKNSIDAEITAAITGEKYSALLNSKTGVDLVSDQTIKGVKTFEDNVNVPAPVSDSSAVNRKYVDDLLSNKLLQWYGIEWDITVSNPQCTRIGNMDLHRSLPLQSAMRRFLQKDDGTVNYYLHPNDSTKRDNGAAAVLDGSHGQVMVSLPDMYVKFEIDGNKRRAMMSAFPLPGFIKWSGLSISAYEATIDRRDSQLPMLASVVNSTPEFRGGGNLPGEILHDGDGGTSRGKPTTNIIMGVARACARNRGSVAWNAYVYRPHKMLVWLYLVEFANSQSQAPFTAELTSEGFRQGGLGEGVTTLDSGRVTAMTGGTSACIPCGITNALGNHTGVVEYTMPPEYGEPKTVQVPSYRGIENPFGHLWKVVDGVIIQRRPENGGVKAETYVCDDPVQFGSSDLGNYEFRGNLPDASGYIKELILGEQGEILPLSTGGSSSTFFCDYMYRPAVPAVEINNRLLMFGAPAYVSTHSGLLSTSMEAGSANTYHIGHRLCYIPQE